MFITMFQGWNLAKLGIPATSSVYCRRTDYIAFATTGGTGRVCTTS